MSDYKQIAKLALKLSNNKGILKEGISYPEGIAERMNPKLEDDIKNKKTSIGDHPALPKAGNSNFEEKIIMDRFVDVVNRYKSTFDVEKIDDSTVIQSMGKLMAETIQLEKSHRKELVELAIKMIREEFDMDEETVDIEANLVDEVSLKHDLSNEAPDEEAKLDFDDHDSMVKSDDEIYKRRLLNAMTQGAAKKCNHMFHMVSGDLMKMDARLVSKFSKLMAAADYLYFVVPRIDKESKGSIIGGVCSVDINGDKPMIKVEALTFPVLINELVKGVMEILSAHGFTEDEELNKYIISQADFLAAEPWDMRIGAALWEKFASMFDGDDFKLKHHVYAELASKPCQEFNECMREIFAGTKAGKRIINDILADVKMDLKRDEFNSATDNDTFNLNDLNGINLDDLFNN